LCFVFVCVVVCGGGGGVGVDDISYIVSGVFIDVFAYIVHVFLCCVSL